MKRLPIEYATRVLLVAVAATPVALFIPGAALWLWLAALAAAAVLALVDLVDLLQLGPRP